LERLLQGGDDESLVLQGGHDSMRLIGLFIVLAVCVLPSQAQQGEYAEEEPATSSKGLNTAIPLPSSRSLSETERAGKKLFIQRCSVCHLPGTLTSMTYGPLLDKKVMAALGDDRARAYILHGSDKMPGWQHTLQAAQIDKIIAYLKTLDFKNKQATAIQVR
jgi:mono/diheme cytochrome c family protein